MSVGPEPTVADEKIKNAFRASEDPFMTAGEVAEAVGISRQGANYRLNRLEERGVVSRKKTGARAVGWWLDEN